jgi:signal peptidase II
MESYGTSRRVQHFTLIALGIIILDQITKLLAAQITEPISVLGSWFTLTLAFNTGGAFSILTGNTVLLGLVNIVVFCAIFYYNMFKKLSRLEYVSFALIAGGALGNAIDRLFYGWVVDFLAIGWWPIFNIADSAIVVGVCLLVVYEVRSVLGKKSK